MISKITCGKTGDRHRLLDQFLCRWRQAQFESAGLYSRLGDTDFLRADGMIKSDDRRPFSSMNSMPADSSTVRNKRRSYTAMAAMSAQPPSRECQGL
jgi:hypothetical protein